MVSKACWCIRAGQQRDRTSCPNASHGHAPVLCRGCRSCRGDRKQVDDRGPQCRSSRHAIPVSLSSPSGGNQDRRGDLGPVEGELPGRTTSSCPEDGPSTGRESLDTSLLRREVVGSDLARHSRQPNGVRRFRIGGGPLPKREHVAVHRHLASECSGPTPSSGRRQRGQVTVVFVALASVLVMLGGLAYDGAQILNARREASTLALEAARAGAQAISTASIYRETGNVFVDPSLARIAVSEYLGQNDEWSISVRGDTVSMTVWLTQPLLILSMLGVDSRRVAGTATARAVRGISTGDDL